MSWRTGIALVLLISAAVLAYARVLDGPAIFDDGYVFDDPVREIETLDAEELVPALTETRAEPRRWLTSLTFSLNFYRFGPGTRSFHVVNLLLHCLAVIACFGFVWELSRAAGHGERAALRVAFLVAALFALNPIQSQAVSFIWQRATVLAAGLSLASLWLFLAGLRAGRVRIVLAVLLVPLAVLAKQNAVMLVPAMIGLGLMFGRSPSIRIHLAVGAVALAAVFIAVTSFWWGSADLVQIVTRGYEGRDFTLGQRLLTQPRVVLNLLSLILVPLPSRLNLDHHVVTSTGLFSPWTTLPALLVIAGAAGLGLALVRRRPLTAIGILWFLVFLIPESSVIALEMMFEHRAYLPSVGVFLLLALGAETLYLRCPRLTTAGALLVLALLSTLTHLRNEVWTSRVLMWSDAASKSPGKARPHFNLALALGDRDPLALEAGRHEADVSFQRALELDPENVDYARAWNRRLMDRAHLTGVPDEVFYQAAEKHRRGGRFVAAEELLRDLVSRHGATGAARPYYELARVLAASGGVPEGLDALERAIELGFGDLDRLREDPALASLRRSPRYQSLLKKIR